MRSGWKVTLDLYEGHTAWLVYRLKDAQHEDVQANREVRATFDSKKEAKTLADNLNKRDAETFWRR